jgi:2-succinyl-5-enolpyruvyl-6-hydroxy-3-cyclohexene-1-carboxylate synthase
VDVDGLVATLPDLTISERAPTHINICFEEPQNENLVVIPNKSVTDFSSVERPLVILGEIPKSKREFVVAKLKKLNVPIYAEAISGLTSVEALKPLYLRGGADFLTPQTFLKYFDGVIRIGGVPTLRLWRDLDLKPLYSIPVLNISDREWTGLAKVANTFSDFSAIEGKNFSMHPEVLLHARKTEARLRSALERFPKSEAGAIYRLSQWIPEGANIFLGNSLPIREWDLVADDKNKNFSYSANRGVNGIDGLISTFLGEVSDAKEHWLLLGDLSALYDLTALWAVQHLSDSVKVRIVIINNGGGQIFSQIFKNSKALNEHEIQFKNWATMFGVDYIESDLKTLPELSRICVIEVRPDLKESAEFWNYYRLGL